MLSIMQCIECQNTHEKASEHEVFFLFRRLDFKTVHFVFKLIKGALHSCYNFPIAHITLYVIK